MSILGIRVSPKIIYLTILTEEEYENQKLVVPINIDVPKRLSYIRSNILSIIKENNVEYIGLRICENVATNISLDRLNIEGVIQEVMSDCNIIYYETFIKSKIRKDMNIEFAELSKLLDIKSEEYPDSVDASEWTKINKVEAREAFLVALCMEGKILE